MIEKISENLARFFIKNHNEVKQAYVRSQYGILEGWLSVFVNLGLGISKIVVGILIGSISLLADGIHSLSDMITSFIVIISFYIGRKPSDEEHPFGHERIEQIAALIIAVLIGVGGFELIKGGIERVIHPQPVLMSITAITLLILTIIFKEILGRISRYYGEKIYSTALEADSWHHRTDAISSVLVIIAILSSQAGFDILDGIIGIVIGLFVIYTGIDIVRRTSIKLLGTKASDELLKQVESLVLINENALAIHDMICHEYGSQLVISFHLEVPSELKLSEAHTIADKIEKRIFNELNIQATVHLDPVLPVLFNKNEIKSVIDSVLSAEETIYQYSELRLIGEESHATLVLDMESRDDITVEKMEYLNNRLKQEILRRIPKLKDVKINFTP